MIQFEFEEEFVIMGKQHLGGNDMNTTWTVKEKSKGDLKVTVEGEHWKNAQTKAFDKIAKNVELPGFRKGQAPKSLISKQISTQQILMEAVDIAAPTALSDALTEHDLFPIARPELSVDEINEESVTMTFSIIVRPEVKLGKYKGVKYVEEKVVVSDEEVDEQIKKIQENFAELVISEGPVALGDTAILDFEGFKDGVAFDGGKGENHPLEIGSHSFIPGFEEQVVGMNIDEAKDILVTFPEDYQAEDLAGKEVTFKVVVHEIKTRHLPELNDDFAKDVNAPNVETFADLKALVNTDITNKKEQETKNEAMNQLLTQVAEGSEVEIPDVLIDDEVENMMEDFARRLQQQGFSVDQFSKMTGQTEEALREQMKPDATNKVKLRLVLDAIAKEEKLEVSDEEIEAEYQVVAEAYNMEIAKVKELASHATIAYDLRLRKAVDFVKESSKN